MRIMTAICHSLLVLFIVSATARSQESARPPNVILVMTDDQGYGDIGAHGNTKIRTPNMDLLASQSVRLSDFHVDPTCSPTRAALMTGRYSTRTGVWHTIMGRSLMDSEELTIAEVLKSAGYRTGMFGKWHLGENYPLRPQDQGFDDVVCHGGGGVGQGPDWWGNDYFDDTYFRRSLPEEFEGYCTDVWFREAMQFVENNKDKPFFCYLATNAPHGPLNVADEWSQPYLDANVSSNHAKFYGMITNIDWNLGRLMAQLDSLEIADNTILIFMTDNGTGSGRFDQKLIKQQKWPGFDAEMRDGKGSEYDGGHRVPFFIRWPKGGIGGGADGGREDGYLAAHIDVLPTLVSLCGVKKPDGPALDGISLADRLRSPEAELPERTLFVHSQRLRYPEKWRKSAVMTERWRLVNGAELFNIQTDPRQKKDMAADRQGIVNKLRTAYEDWWQSLTPEFDQSVYIGLGSSYEPTVQLHPHDWQVEKGAGCSWHQKHVRDGHMGQGTWYVNVLARGNYEIELRRWPRHVDRPIEAVHARVKVGKRDWECDVSPGSGSTTFEVRLAKGRTTLQTWLTLSNGETRGAYFVYVTRR